MMSSFGMFWPSLFNTPNIDEILEKAKNIDDILDQENILTGIKSSNTKFANYMNQHPEMIKSLIDYVIKEQKDLSQKQSYKFPLIASDIFAAEVPNLINAFFQDLRQQSLNSDILNNKKKILIDNIDEIEQQGDDHDDNQYYEEEQQKQEDDDEDYEDDDDEEDAEKNDQEKEVDNTTAVQEEDEKKEEETEVEQIKENILVGIKLLDYLFTYFDNNKQLNQTLAGYFCKTVSAILNKRSKDVIIQLYINNFIQAQSLNNQFQLIVYIFDNNKMVLNNFLNQISCKSISDLFWKLVTFDISDKDQLNDLYLDERCQLVNDLIIKFKSTDDIEEQQNISDFLIELLQKHSQIVNGKRLIQVILNESNMQIIYDKIQAEDFYQVYASASVLEQVLVYSQGQSQQKQNMNQNDSNDDDVVLEDENDCDDPVIQQFAQNLPSILQLLTSETKYTINSTYGEQIKPFGRGKLKVLEIINFSFKIDNPKIVKIHLQNQTFKLLMNTLKQYQWNNFLHIQIKKLFTYVIESTHTDYKKSLFDDCQLIEFITEIMNNSIYSFKNEQQRQLRVGYSGHIIKLSNEIIALSQKDQELEVQLNASNFQFLLQILMIYLDNEFQTYKSSQLKEMNEKNNTNLGNHNPRQESETIDDDEGDQKQDEEIEQIFQKYSHYFQNNQFQQKKDDDEDEIEDDDDNYENDELDQDLDNDYDNDVNELHQNIDLKLDDVDSHINSYIEKMQDNENPRNLQQNNSAKPQEKEQENVDEEYYSHKFWKTNTLDDDEIDRLMAEEFQ